MQTLLTISTILFISSSNGLIETDFCATAFCPKETICSETQKSCIPIIKPPTNPCAVVFCPPGSECKVVFDSFAQCSPIITNPCAVLLCPSNTECINVNGIAQCRQKSSWCRKVFCGPGTICSEIEKKCIPEPPFCQTALCAKGTICSETQKKCIPLPPFCEIALCEKNEKCDEELRKCVPITTNPCAVTLCPKFYECQVIDNNGICLSIQYEYCGGFAGKKCPSEGYECVDDPRDNCTPECGGADCIGICVKTFIDKEGNGANCGGKMGSMCPEGFKCFDDDSDTCNPQCGGADCLGFCADPVRKENVV
eukprot:498721_1